MTKTRERSRRIQKEKGRVLKSLISKNTSKSAGRNSAGRITSFHRGGGSKRLQRTVDLKRNTPATGVVERIEYDPNRSSRVALVRWIDGVNFLRRQKRADDVGNLAPPPQSKSLESPISSVFSFNALPGSLDQKKLSSFSLSQAKCLPKNYIMIGQASVKSSPFSSPPLIAKREAVSGTASSSSSGSGLPRIAVAGAKPAFFAPRTMGVDPIGENLTVGEIQKWKNVQSVDRKNALSWQSSGVGRI